MTPFLAPDEAATRALGAALARQLVAGDVVLLYGELGAGKTTLVRGLLEALGEKGHVRSPTFNLIQTFETTPPVMHSDLYRVSTIAGIGIEDYLESHICLIEWAEKAEGLVPDASAWHIRIEFAAEGRAITIETPAGRQTPT